MSTRTGSRGGVSAPAIDRRRAVGAGVQPDGVYFRVWAPRRTAVDAVIAGSETVALSVPA
ncbi:MAG: hypothetical protein ABI637_07530 [Gemmatimonadota bacterium]